MTTAGRGAGMVAWRAVVDSEPEFAQRVQTMMDAHRHKTLATLRADGAPRISGIEASFVDGQLWFGSMPGARKGQDLRRDPRFALHSASVDPPQGQESSWSVIELWRPDRPLHRIQRH